MKHRWTVLLLAALAASTCAQVPGVADCRWLLLNADEASLPYESILDAPIDWVAEDRGTPEANTRLRIAWERWRMPPEGLGTLDHFLYLKEMAPHWLRRVRGYLSARSDWTFDQRARVLRRFCQLIRERLVVQGRCAPWTLSVHESKDGHVVVTGEKHRLVLLNQEAAPLVTGPIPVRERGWIERAGGPRRYYPCWIARDLPGANLNPVRRELLWEGPFPDRHPPK